MSASNQSFLAKYEAVLKRQSATLRSLGIVSTADDAVDDALADSDIALPDTVAGAFRSDDDDYKTIPQEQAPPNIDFDEEQEDKEGGFSEQAKVCCKHCNRYRFISHYDTLTQLHLDANPIQCSTIGRSCSEPDDRLDMGVTTRTIITDRHGNVPSNVLLSERQVSSAKRVKLDDGSEALVVEADESTLFQGIDGHDKGCNFMELAGYAMVQVVGSADEVHMVPKKLLVGVPSTPPNYEPENRTLTRYERFIKTATEDRKYSFFTQHHAQRSTPQLLDLPSSSQARVTSGPRPRHASMPSSKRYLPRLGTSFEATAEDLAQKGA